MFYNFWTTSISCETPYFYWSYLLYLSHHVYYPVYCCSLSNRHLLSEYGATCLFLALGQSVRISTHVCGQIYSRRLLVRGSVQLSISSTDMILLDSKRRSPESFLTAAGTICQSRLWFKVSSAINNSECVQWRLNHKSDHASPSVVTAFKSKWLKLFHV